MGAERLTFSEDRRPVKIDGHLVFSRAYELAPGEAQRFWQEKNQLMDKLIERENVQVIVLNTYSKDATSPFCRFFQDKPLGRYPLATTTEQEFPDGELNIFILNEEPQAESIYLVAPILNERDSSRVRRVADHFKRTLNAKFVTLVAPFFFGERQDKNVDQNKNYVPTTLNLRAEIGGLSGFVDRMMTFEPHSSATQAFAAEFSIPLVPFSPWHVLVEHLMKNRFLVPSETIVVRPDTGRNLIATKIQAYLGAPFVSFEKVRISGQEVDVYELPADEQGKVKGKIGLIYDDEISTMGTISRIADALSRYQAEELIVCVAHGKFTSGWEKRIEHPLISQVVCSDSREAIGNIALSPKIKVVSLAPLIWDLIKADISGANFWQAPEFKDLVL